MKFLVDAHLPPGLCAVFETAGHDAMHTRQLPAQNQTPDEVINILSAKEQLVVVVMSVGPGEIRKYYREQMAALVYGAMER